MNGAKHQAHEPAAPSMGVPPPPPAGADVEWRPARRPSPWPVATGHAEVPAVPQHGWQPDPDGDLAYLTPHRQRPVEGAEIPDLLADRLFLAAHNARGEPAVDRSMVEWGVAAALWGELAVTGHLSLMPTSGKMRAQVANLPVPAGGITQTLWQTLRDQPGMTVRDWIAWAAPNARRWVGDRLELAGYVVHEEHKRRLRGGVKHAWPPYQGTLGVYLRNRLDGLAADAHRLPPPDPQEPMLPYQQPDSKGEVVLVAVAHAIRLIGHGLPDRDGVWTRSLVDDVHLFCIHAATAIGVLSQARRP